MGNKHTSTATASSSVTLSSAANTATDESTTTLETALTAETAATSATNTAAANSIASAATASAIVRPSVTAPQTKKKKKKPSLVFDHSGPSLSENLLAALKTHLKSVDKKTKDQDIADLVDAFLEDAAQRGVALRLDTLALPSHLTPLSSRCVALLSDGPLLRLQVLEELVLPGKIELATEEAGAAFGRLLAHFSKYLRKVDLSNCRMTAAAAVAFSRSAALHVFPALTELALAQNPLISDLLEADGLAAVCAGLVRQSKRMIKLDLRNCSIGLDGCRALAKALAVLRTGGPADAGGGRNAAAAGLVLLLADNPAIGAPISVVSSGLLAEKSEEIEGAEEEASILPAAHFVGQALRELSLDILDLSRCGLTDDSLAILEPFLKRTRRLGELKLAGNPLRASGKGFSLFLNALPSAKALAALDLSDCPALGEEGGIAVSVALVGGKSSFSSLCSLDLSNTSISEDAAREVISAVADLSPPSASSPAERVIRLSRNADFASSPKLAADLVAFGAERGVTVVF